MYLCVKAHTVFIWFVVHIQIVVQCVTIWVQITLFLWLILIVAHPRIVSHVQILGVSDGKL